MNDMPTILHEDSDLIVVDKPSGLPCLPTADDDETTVASALARTYPELASLPDFGLVHRLDNDTSGVLLVARNEDAYRLLRAQFRDNKAKKEYVALVLGHVHADRGEIATPIAHHPRKLHKMLACPDPADAEELKARPAHTSSPVGERIFGSVPCSLLSVHIATGVRHQIRVHLASIGHPLAGDRLYQTSRRQHEDTLPLKHHFLHASSIAFTHPQSGKTITVFAPLPEDLEGLLARLRSR